MFGRKRKNGIEVTKLSSLIADNLHIIGDVHFSGGLRVDGRIEGNVYGKPGEKSLLVLSDKGIIAGKVHVHDAVINGDVTGDLEVDHFVELQDHSNVVGNVRYRQLQMDCGATVDGQLVRIQDTEEGPVELQQSSVSPASSDDAAPATAVSMSRPVAAGRSEDDANELPSGKDKITSL